MFIILTYLLAFVLFLIFYYRYVVARSMYRLLSNIPKPSGNSELFVLRLMAISKPENFLQNTEQLFVRFGKLVYLSFFNFHVVTSADAEFNEQILSSKRHIVKHRNYKILHQWLGTGLLMSDGSKWFARRKILTPAFHFNLLEQFLEIYEQQATVLVERLAENADGCTQFDIYSYICLAALDIIAASAMGTQINAQTKVNNEYVKAVKSLTRIMILRFIKLHLSYEIIFTILRPDLKLRQMKCIKVLHAFTDNVIEERRRTLETALKNSTIKAKDVADNMDGAPKNRMALLDVLLQATIDGKPLTNADIREEVDTFMFAGHDTSTSALCFTLHLISRHATVQQKLFDELCCTCGSDKNFKFTLNILNKLKYMECVIKEALRLYPPVPIVARNMEEDFIYTHSRFGNGVIPAGTEVMICLYNAMRDGEYFEQPNDFIPERFLDDASIHRFVHIPFSAGTRNCIGQKFAMLELKVVLAKILLAYQLLPLGATVEPELNIVLRSTNGFQLGLRKRSMS